MLRTPICDRFGIETPIFGFSHSVEVVSAICNAGGFGVYGATRRLPGEIEAELAAIRAAVGPRAFGVDLVIPASIPEKNDRAELEKMIPDRAPRLRGGHREEIRRARAVRARDAHALHPVGRGPGRADRGGRGLGRGHGGAGDRVSAPGGGEDEGPRQDHRGAGRRREAREEGAGGGRGPAGGAGRRCGRAYRHGRHVLPGPADRGSRGGRAGAGGGGRRHRPPHRGGARARRRRASGSARPSC